MQLSRKSLPEVLAQTRTALILTLASVHLLKVLFLPEVSVGPLRATIAAIALAFCLPFVKKNSKGITYAVFFVGLGMLLILRLGWQVWVKAFETNLHLVTLIVFVPMLGMAIEQGGYVGPLLYLYRRFVNNGLRLYFYNKILAFSIGLILNLGALPVVFALTPFDKASGDVKRLLTISIARGYACGLLISPGFVSVGMVLQYLYLSWPSIAAVGIFIAAIMIAIGCLLEAPRARRVTIDFDAEEVLLEEVKNPVLKLTELALFIAITLMAVFLIDATTRLSVLTAAPAVAVVLSLLWVIYVKRSISAYGSALMRFVKVKARNLESEIVLFIAAGVLATALEASGFGNRLPAIINGLSGGNALMTSGVIYSLILFFSLIGVHPIVTVSVILATIDPQAVGISRLLMGVLLLFGWSAGIGFSPFSGDNLIVASLSKLSPVTIGVRWSALYTFLNAFIVLCFLYLLHLAGVL